MVGVVVKQQHTAFGLGVLAPNDDAALAVYL